MIETPFYMSHMEKMRGNGFESLLGRSHLDTKGKFFPMRKIMQWNSQREVVDSQMLHTFKIWLNSVLNPSCLNCASAKEGWDT